MLLADCLVQVTPLDVIKQRLQLHGSAYKGVRWARPLPIAKPSSRACAHAAPRLHRDCAQPCPHRHRDLRGANAPQPCADFALNYAWQHVATRCIVSPRVATAAATRSRRFTRRTVCGLSTHRAAQRRLRPLRCLPRTAPRESSAAVACGARALSGNAAGDGGRNVSAKRAPTVQAVGFGTALKGKLRG